MSLLKDSPRRAAVHGMERDHLSQRRMALSRSLLVDGNGTPSSDSNKDQSPSGTGSSGNVGPPPSYKSASTDMDGAILTWNVGDWGDCSSDCGPGGQSRTVVCYNSDLSSVVPDSVCSSDSALGGKPITEQDCMGPCITCTDRKGLFVSAGLAEPPVTPVKAASSEYACRVEDSSYSCCDWRVERSIVTQVIAINKGFRSIPDTAQDEVKYVDDFVANSTAEFTERLDATETQLTSVESLLDQASKLKMDKKVKRALKVARDVLKNRVSDLKNAVSNSTLITAFLHSQLGVLINDISLKVTPAAGTSNISSSSDNRQPMLADCANATISLFSSLSCAACSPSFMTDNFPSNSNRFSSLNVSSTLCESVYKQCAPTMKSSRKYLEQALRVMRRIHSQLARAAARLQPALAAVWEAVSFDWLPASTKPASQYVPDITSLECIKSASAFEIDSAISVGDFCANYFDTWNYQLTINKLLKDLKVGVQAMDSLQRCDKCVHIVLTKISEIISLGKGNVDVTLSLDPAALANSGCFGLSTSSSSSSSSSTSTKNLFAVAEGDIWVGSEKSVILEKSNKAISLMIKDEKNIPPSAPFVQILRYTPDGLDPSTIATVNWTLIRNASHAPPPSLWTERSSAEVAIIVTDINCTSHVSCNPDGGDSPYWFCGTSRVCNNPISCDDNEKLLLSTHPKCVKGLCVDDSTAVDGKCPDIAICPATKSGQFDHMYFGKYRSIAPIEPPSGSLVAAKGANTAGALTQATNYAKGVCDCAFAKKTAGQNAGDSVLVVGDVCMYAQCLAYALANEKLDSCASDLLTNCKLLQKSSCPNVFCDKEMALWNAPACDLKTDKTEDGFALSSDTRTAGAWKPCNAILGIVIALSLAILA